MKLETYMEKLKSGDMEALDFVYEATSKSVYFLAYGILRNKERAEDVMQETYVRVVQGAAGYKNKLKASAWILRIARNLCYSEYMKSKRNLCLEQLELEPQDAVNEEDDWIINMDLRGAMSCLKPTEREIVSLFALKEYKHREIAKIVGRPTGSVQWAYNNAIKKMRKFLQGGKSNESKGN